MDKVVLFFQGTEEWEDVTLQQLEEDFGLREEQQHQEPVLPGLKHDGHSSQRAVITWLLYLLLRWQTSNLISDRALQTLLVFLGSLFTVIGMQSSYVKAMSEIFPSLYRVRNWIDLKCDDYTGYVVCPNVGCNQIYLARDKLKKMELLYQRNVTIHCLSKNAHQNCSRELFSKTLLSLSAH